MSIYVDDKISITPMRASDKKDLIEQINDQSIYENTLLIPYPYTEREADWWIDHVAKQEAINGCVNNWIIRNENGVLMGGIGLLYKHGKDSHKEELGYWLGKSHRNKGIMSKSIKAFTQYCFDKRNYERIEAIVFSYNQASARTLEKAGFEREGYIKKAYRKDNEYIDGIVYAKLK